MNMFNLPSIPTDSLYKFLFVGGLILIIASFFFYDKQNNPDQIKLYSSIDSVNVELVMLYKNHTRKEQFLNLLPNELNSKASHPVDVLNDLYVLYYPNFQTDKDFSDEFKLLSYCNKHYFADSVIKNHHNDLIVMAKNLSMYEKVTFDTKNAGLRNRGVRYRYAIGEKKNANKILTLYIIMCLVIGLIFSFIGVIMWYFKQQRRLDELLTMQIAQINMAIKSQKIQDDILEKQSLSQEPK